MREAIIQVVGELGIEGLPPVQRVDELFDKLLGTVFEVTVQGRSGRIDWPQNTDLDNEIGGGELGRLGNVFGLIRANVFTVEEERGLTDFLLLKDYVKSLRDSWDEFKPRRLVRAKQRPRRVIDDPAAGRPRGARTEGVKTRRRSDNYGCQGMKPTNRSSASSEPKNPTPNQKAWSTGRT